MTHLPSTFKPRRNDFLRPPPTVSSSRTLEHLSTALSHWARSLRKTLLQYSTTRRRRGGRTGVAIAMVEGVVRWLRVNLQPRRLLSVPHLLVAFWVLVLLWGERWVFESRVRSCDWHHWEDWPSGTTPHHLILVADPQLIDPHSYPDRSWPLTSLTYRITDNYLRRSYTALEHKLQPDSIFFLGDLFDGGREWRTYSNSFEDPPWGRKRPAREAQYVPMWKKKYGHEFWHKEYARFVDIFMNGWNALGTRTPGSWQRGRKMVASLPGNHDHGFGTQVKTAARDRFETFFGDVNRVDVVGNHTIVSVDTLSLSAQSADAVLTDRTEIKAIYDPVVEFLKEVPEMKRRAVERELRFWHGSNLPNYAAPKLEHAVYTVDTLPKTAAPSPDAPAPEFPTILLTHVPLYREPGTPCGPLREHWPPARPASGQQAPVRPDHRNAISVSGGYQYQNVLAEQDSQMLVRSVGSVVHVFSGDDHDYCEFVHDGGGDKAGIKEITVKSISMAMGVPTPGFLMVSMYNPVDANGVSLQTGSRKGTTPTLQTHLCLLPNQFSTYTRYIAFGIITVVMLALRAFLVPTLNLAPFALDQNDSRTQPPKSPLPLYNTEHENPHTHYATSHPSSSASYSGRHSATNSTSRTRSGSLLAAQAQPPSQSTHLQPPSTFMPSRSSTKKGKPYQPSSGSQNLTAKRWGWGETAAGKQLRINVSADDLYDGAKERSWRPAGWRRGLGRLGGGGIGGTGGLRVALRELVTSVWRVVWMAVGIWAYLTWKG